MAEIYSQEEVECLRFCQILPKVLILLIHVVYCAFRPSDDRSSSWSSVAAGIGGGLAVAAVLLIAVVVVLVYGSIEC